MEFRHNIILSIVMHAIPLIAAVTLIANRESSSRVADRSFTVALTEDSEMPKSPSAEREKTERVRPAKSFSSSRATPPLIQPWDHKEKGRIIPSVPAVSFPPSVPGSGIDALPFVEEGNGPANIGAVGPAPSTDTVPASVPDEVAMSRAREADGPDSLSISAIRAAIDRAKTYPALARKRGQEGTVVMQFSIDSRGLPGSLRIVKSSGFSILDAAAKDTVVKAAPFPVVNGRIEIPITFVLEEEN